jgi:hypothetical protein
MEAREAYELFEVTAAERRDLERQAHAGHGLDHEYEEGRAAVNLNCPSCKQPVASAYSYCPWCGTPLKGPR